MKDKTEAAAATAVKRMGRPGGDFLYWEKTKDLIDQLYVAPDRLGEGIGRRLLDLAKRGAAGRLELWTFQENEQARRFYERNGFVPTEAPDGSGNEEGEPDVRYTWDPRGESPQSA